VDEIEKFLIIGLGNPGRQYQHTRHNVGFSIAQMFALKQKTQFKHASHLCGDIASALIGDKKVLILLPTTFMNSSGDAVRRCVDYYKVPLDHLMVICDDVALPLGVMRMRSRGSCGGHNGLKSIETHLNTEHYARLRVGVGGPDSEALSDYVLGQFSQEENKIIEEAAVKAIHVLELWMSSGIASAMQTANSIKSLS
jgi:peptidyl-tRNA hydrolase, PTH1 family